VAQKLGPVNRGNGGNYVRTGFEWWRVQEPQSLFTEDNQRYFGGRLPRYKVLLTNDLSRCERRKRRIYINPDKENVSVILLHEIVHAAVGRGHGKVWRDEVR
jgi:hypothetical protein